VRAHEGKIVAWDQERQPCVVTNEFGAGLATLVTQPLEYFLSFSRELPTRSYVLYCMACRGLEPPIQYDLPSVEAKLFHREDGELIVFVNLDNSPVEFDVKLAFEHAGRQDVIASVLRVAKIEMNPIKSR
jgi:hypothetical protein